MMASTSKLTALIFLILAPSALHGSQARIGSEGEWVLGSGLIYDAAYSDDDGTIAVCSSNGLLLVDAAAREVRKRIPLPMHAKYCEWAPDGQSVVVILTDRVGHVVDRGDEIGILGVVNCITGGILTLDEFPVYLRAVDSIPDAWGVNLSFSKDSTSIAFISTENEIVVCSAQTGDVQCRFPASNPEEKFFFVDFTGDDTGLWVGTHDGYLHNLDIESGELVHSIQFDDVVGAYGESPRVYAISPDERYAVTEEWKYAMYGYYRVMGVFEIASGALTLSGPEMRHASNAHFPGYVPPYRVSHHYVFSSDSSSFWTEHHGDIFRFDIASETVIQEESVDDTNLSRPLSHDGQKALIYQQHRKPWLGKAYMNGLNVFDSRTQIQEPLFPDAARFSGFAFSSTNKLLTLKRTSPSMLEVWDVETKTHEMAVPLADCHGGAELPGDLAVSSDGQTAVGFFIWGRLFEIPGGPNWGRSICMDGAGRPVNEPYHPCFRFSHDNSLLMEIFGSHIVIWDMEAQKYLHTFLDMGYDAVFTSDDRSMLAVDASGSMKLVNLTTGESEQVLEHERRFVAVRLLEREIGVLLVDEQGQVLIYDTQTEQLLHRFSVPTRHGKETIVLFPDESHLIVGRQVFDFKTGELVSTFGEDAGSIFWIKISSDGRWIGALTRSQPDERFIRIWDAEKVLQGTSNVMHYETFGREDNAEQNGNTY